jgi:hypothetical protein
VAYGRTSPRGLQHFVHPPQSGCAHSGETHGHLIGKAEILGACAESGHEAQTEHTEDGWRADVLATRGDVRVAFEVQIGRLPLRDMLERQQRYRRSGVRGCWFCTHPPQEMRASGVTGDLIARRDLPLFQIEPDVEHGFSVHLGGRRYPLARIVASLLAGRIAFRESAAVRPEPSIAVGLYSIRCRHCSGALTVRRPLGCRLRGRSACGAELRWSVHGDSPPSRHDPCPHCGTPLGRLDLPRRPDAVVPRSVESARLLQLHWPHWCFAEGGSFC